MKIARAKPRVPLDEGATRSAAARYLRRFAQSSIKIRVIKFLIFIVYVVNLQIKIN